MVVGWVDRNVPDSPEISTDWSVWLPSAVLRSCIKISEVKRGKLLIVSTISESCDHSRYVRTVGIT